MLELLETVFTTIKNTHAVKDNPELLEVYRKINKAINFRVRIIPGPRIVECQTIKDKEVRYALIYEDIYVAPTQTYHREVIEK